MVTQTNEQALESTIEQKLTGTCLEALKAKKASESKVEESQVPFGSHHGYELGYSRDFNARFSVDEKWFWAFLEKTQEKELVKLSRNSIDKTEWQQKILERLDRMIKKKGLPHLLKKGLSVDDAHLVLMYPAPLASSSDTIKTHFKNNIFSSTRQVHYSLESPKESIDLVLFINAGKIWYSTGRWQL